MDTPRQGDWCKYTKKSASCVWQSRFVQFREVVQLSEPNRKGKVSRWRAEAKRKKDRERKRKEKRRKARHGGVARETDKGVAICGMMKANEPDHPTTRKDTMRNYTTQHVPGAHLNFSQRQTLASDWNATVNAGCRITLRQFAAKHGLRYETWRREHLRGATGAAVPDPKDRRRRRTWSTRTARTRGPGCW